MDNNSWRPAPGGGGEPTMDAGDWRSQLQPDSRQRIVNKMVPPPHIQSKQQSQQSQSQITQVHPMHENQMNPQLQSMNLQVSSVATMQNNVATLRHNSLSSLSGFRTTSQSMISTLQPGSTIDSDSTDQRGNANSGDWQEEIYQKIEVMKEAYLPELTEMYHKIVGKLQKHDSLSQQPKNEQFEKLKIFKAMLERVLQFLQVPKSNILPNFKEKLPSYEKQIFNFLDSNRPRKPGLSLQQGQQIPPPHIQSMQQSQSQITQVHPIHENQMNPQPQSMNLQGSSVATMQNNVATLQHNSLSSLSGVPTSSQSMISTLQPGSTIDSASLDSTAQRGNANSGDWQEEIYQKIEVMKEAYLPELTEMYHKIVGKLQQHDSLSQQPKNEQFEKLKLFKTMLERILQFLQVPKSNILPNFKEKLPVYEKQIANFLNSNRPRKPGPSLQQGQQIPPPHIQFMPQSQQSQSQITQVHPMHENQMNPHLQSMNLQGSSVASMQQNNGATLQHNSLSFLSGVPTTPQSLVGTLQPGSTIDSGQGSELNALQQVAVGSVQQNLVNAQQQAHINSLSSHSGMNVLQPNLAPLQSNSNMLS